MTTQATDTGIETLIRRLRSRQKEYFAFRWKTNPGEKTTALEDCKQLENEVLDHQSRETSILGRLAERMITLQRKFFKTRGPLARREAIDAERRVDYELDQLTEKKKVLVG